MRWRRIPWRLVLLASYVGTNLVLIPTKIVLDPDVPVDWQVFSSLPQAIADGSVYEIGHRGVPFVWSPVAAWLMAAAATIGYWPWVFVHVMAALLLVRTPLLLGLVLVSYGFWFDVAQGNTLTFALVAGILALQGSRPASLAYLAMVMLVPRPLAAPLAIWLLWHDRSLWRPTVAVFAVHAALVLASGDLQTWLAAMLGNELGRGYTIGPTAWVGTWWLLLGIPLGAWLTWRGHVGWAGIAISPYIAPQYVIWPLLELERRPVHRAPKKP